MKSTKDWVSDSHKKEFYEKDDAKIENKDSVSTNQGRVKYR